MTHSVESRKAYLDVTEKPGKLKFTNEIGGTLITGIVGDEAKTVRYGCNQGLPCKVRRITYCVAYDETTPLDELERMVRGHKCGKYLVNDRTIETIMAQISN